MNNSGVQANFYLGIVKEHKENFQITADIPGIALDVEAFPLRGDCDEPKPGDPVILLGLDPEYNSYFLYWKLKENDFTGFRAYGKEISIEEDALVIRSYSGENTDDSEKEPSGENSSIRLDKDGNIKINVSGDAEIVVKNEAKIEAKTATVKAVDVEIGASEEMGIGTLTIKSQSVIPDPAGGPFIAFPGQLITPTPGTPIPTGSTIILKK